MKIKRLPGSNPGQAVLFVTFMLLPKYVSFSTLQSLFYNKYTTFPPSKIYSILLTKWVHFHNIIVQIQYVGVLGFFTNVNLTKEDIKLKYAVIPQHNQQQLYLYNKYIRRHMLSSVNK